ncbi:MAG TPA: tRNA (adenosine(37)-N6)-threonylcarbamoyltransferase complex ATPase subunit type 1 TsaE [Ignavibacteriaceae bacterium]
MEFPFKAVVESESETETIAKSFAAVLTGGEVVVLSGELGAGKTFFVKKTLINYGITWVNSPSFAIVNEYKNSFKFYHIDFYRLKSIKELFNIGFDDYLNDKDAIVFIEWGNLFPEVLPHKRIEINFKMNSDNSREIRILRNA